MQNTITTNLNYARTMKKILTILFLTIIAIGYGYAQEPHRRMSKEDFKAKQQKFLMQKAGITEEEAAAFFPVYYEMQDKKAAINNKAWESARKGKLKDMSEEQYARMINELAKAKIKADQIELDYIPKFKKIISAKKLFQLQIAEMKFHREMLRGMHKQQHNKKN
jgi:hypothetical protein